MREPGLRFTVVSPGPVKCSRIVVISKIARRSMSVFNPSSAGKELSFTVGVVNVPRSGSPSRSTKEMGRVQS